jgi:hypothetical protein
MYTYYLLAALGPRVQPYLWWKKYLTAFQMLQFVAIMIHAFQLLFIDCNYPKAFVWWIGMHAVMFFFLFNEFYQQSYAQRNRKAAGKYLYLSNRHFPFIITFISSFRLLFLHLLFHFKNLILLNIATFNMKMYMTVGNKLKILVPYTLIFALSI